LRQSPHSRTWQVATAQPHRVICGICFVTSPGDFRQKKKSNTFPKLFEDIQNFSNDASIYLQNFALIFGPHDSFASWRILVRRGNIATISILGGRNRENGFSMAVRIVHAFFSLRNSSV